MWTHGVERRLFDGIDRLSVPDCAAYDDEMGRVLGRDPVDIGAPGLEERSDCARRAYVVWTRAELVSEAGGATIVRNCTIIVRRFPRILMVAPPPPIIDMLHRRSFVRRSVSGCTAKDDRCQNVRTPTRNSIIIALLYISRSRRPVNRLRGGP